jgi:hypothetical protein
MIANYAMHGTVMNGQNLKISGFDVFRILQSDELLKHTPVPIPGKPRNEVYLPKPTKKRDN